MSEHIYLYDTTLRDGAQTKDVNFSVTDKQDIAILLDKFGIDYIEGGWPGANPIDDKFFSDLPILSHAKMTAFGMTKKLGVEKDKGLDILKNSLAPSVCIVGKTWDFHVTKALGISLKDNLKIIAESIYYLKDKEVLFDAEHFFDGYKVNPEYAVNCLKAAFDNGARWIVLCDTNGGVLPHEIGDITAEVSKYIPAENIGIHCHNDTENAVANSLMAVRAGAKMVQGTLNGLGERCGNANLISIIPNLMLKMGYSTSISKENLSSLSALSYTMDEKLNRSPNKHNAYVGKNAFAHKAGLHVSAIAKDTALYEHIDPSLVGNERKILVSDKAGRSNIIARLNQIGVEVDNTHKKIPELVQLIKQRESEGYAYEAADASFELLARNALEKKSDDFYKLKSFRVLSEKKAINGNIIPFSEATVKIEVDGNLIMTAAEGNGPINALDNALKKALVRVYSSIEDMVLVDYRVRILTPEEGTKALVRVLIEYTDSSAKRWTTIGVSENVIDASYEAMKDGIIYKLKLL